MTGLELATYLSYADVVVVHHDMKGLVDFIDVELAPVYDAWNARVNAGQAPSVRQICEDAHIEVLEYEIDKPSDYVFFKWIKSIKIRKIFSDVMQATSESERQALMKDYISLASSTDDSEVDVDLSSEYSLADHLSLDSQGILYPAVELNVQFGSVLPGWAVVVSAMTGGGKTTFMNSVIGHNSFKRDKRCLYIYSEARVQEYQAGIWSCVSQGSPNPRVASAFKRVKADDEDGKLFLIEFHEWYKKTMCGDIIFVYAGSLDSDPLVMASQLKRLVKKYDIDYFVVDTLSRMSSSPAAGYKDANTYGKFLTTMFTDLCVAESISGFLLCQLARSGEEKTAKAKAVSMVDILGADSVKDASQILVINSSAELREQKIANIFCIKNRHGDLSPKPVTVTTAFEYSYIGDPWDGSPVSVETGSEKWEAFVGNAPPTEYGSNVDF